MKRSIARFLSIILLLVIGCQKVETSDVMYTKQNLINMVNEIANNREVSFSSNAYDYINAKRDIFDLIVNGGENTVTIFVNILKDSTSFGLDKYIMAAACAEITGIGIGEDKKWATAKDWLVLYLENIDDVSKSNE